MSAQPGDRVLFERAAGKGLPRVPRETSEERWAYVLIRDGSICCVVRDRETTPGDQKALDAGAACLPPRPEGGVHVSRRGHLTAEDLKPVQDWMVVIPDAPIEEIDPAPRRRKKKLHGADGRTLRIIEDNPQERYELWSCSIEKRGPGLLTITRCIDGDRIDRAPMPTFHHTDGVRPAKRVLLQAELPFAQPIDDLAPLACGAPFLARGVTVVAVLG